MVSILREPPILSGLRFGISQLVFATLLPLVDALSLEKALFQRAMFGVPGW